MTKKIIKYYIILLVIFFSWVNLAHAGLEITEIMYAPENGANYEWVEILNNGSTSIDLNKYRFVHGETSGPLTLKVGDITVLQPYKYAIIVKSLSSGYDWIDFSGPIFSAGTLSLSDDSSKYNTYIAITDSSPERNVLSEITYDTSKGGSKISKTSLSKIGGEWTSATPTPGKTNSSSADSSENSSEDNTVDETIDPVPLIKEDPAILKITTKITSPKIVTAGIPFSLSSLTTTNRGETYAVGKFVWNFGDGMVREIREANPFEYTYQYPGDYALTLSYFESVFSTKPDAVDKVTIKVVPAGINISSVGTYADPFVEIENKSSYEIILSNWVVTAGIHYFIIPEGTTLLPSKKIKLSPKITGFVGEDLNSIVISNQSKEIIATYPIQIIKPIQKTASVNKTANSNPVPADNPQDASLLKDPQVINLNDLGASAENTGINISNSIYPLVGLLVVIGLGVASFLLIKRKRNVGDYVEQGISAKDMTIVE